MEKCSGGPGLSTGDGEVKRALLGVHNNPLFTTYISVSKVEGVSSPPFRTIFFPEATCGHRAGRRGRRLLREKRGLLDWFITKVAPSGNRFTEAGEASRHSHRVEDASTPRVEQTRVFVQHQETSVPLEENRFFSNPIVEGLTFAYKTKMHCAPMSLHTANHHPRLQPRPTTCLKAIRHSSLSQCRVLMYVSG